MSRPFSAGQHIEAARQQRDQAKSIDEFRQALAVLMPLELGLSLASGLAARSLQGGHLHHAHPLFRDTR